MTNPSQHSEPPRVVYPRGMIAPDRLPRGIAAPASMLYGGLSSVARRIGLGRRPAPRGEALIVSVGNIEVGGNGKTPFAIHLLTELRLRGHHPVYLSRGYGSASERLKMTTVVPAIGEPVKPGSSTEFRRVDRGTEDLAGEIGDEGAVVASRCPDTPLLFDRDRTRGAGAALALFGATHVVIDDAFQTWGTARDVDIVLVDGAHPFGNGRILPAGTLREKPIALERADLIGVNGAQGSSDIDAVAQLIRKSLGHAKPVFGIRRRITFWGADGSSRAAPRAACSLSAIARPAAFDAGLTAAGVGVSLSIRYPDHYRYGDKDLESIHEILATHPPVPVVTTEKDWVKLAAFGRMQDVVVARLELELIAADAIWQKMEKPRTGSAASARR